jgi:hypothetical protein
MRHSAVLRHAIWTLLRHNGNEPLMFACPSFASIGAGLETEGAQPDGAAGVVAGPARLERQV